MNARTDDIALLDGERHPVDRTGDQPVPGDSDPWRSAPALGAARAGSRVAEAQRAALFREEAIEARQSQWMGDILIARSPRSGVFAAVAALVAISIIALMVLGEYTRAETAMGEVQSTLGTAKVYPQQAGVIVKQIVQDGQHVKRGDPLFLVSLDRSTAKGDTQAGILGQLDKQKSALRKEQQQQRTMADEAARSYRERIRKTEGELVELRAAMALQERRVELAQTTLTQYRELTAQHYFSATSLNDKEREALDAQTRLRELARQVSTSERDLETLQSDLRNQPIKVAGLVSTLQRQIDALEQNSIDTEMRREFIVSAPHDGTVTAILAHSGQSALPNVPLASVLPDGASLEVNLYAPSRTVGFVREGAPVLVRFEAFPYQKFGQYAGTVAEVSRSAIAPNELPLPLRTEESLYRIRVKLARPYVTAYGKTEALQSGMRVEAKIKIDTRKLYEWVLEPLYSLKGFRE